MTWARSSVFKCSILHWDGRTKKVEREIIKMKRKKKKRTLYKIMNNKYDQTHASVNVCTYVQCSIHIFLNVCIHRYTKTWGRSSYIHLCTMHMLAYLNIYSFLYMSFNCFFFIFIQFTKMFYELKTSYSKNLANNV